MSDMCYFVAIALRGVLGAGSQGFLALRACKAITVLFGREISSCVIYFLTFTPSPFYVLLAFSI
jgi:hypothetical protein